jgi:hypothetical protein
MSKMREAFENYYGGDKRPSVRFGVYIDFITQAAWEGFEAGYQAAIADAAPVIPAGWVLDTAALAKYPQKEPS